jgi:predicted CoA-binding protein
MGFGPGLACSINLNSVLTDEQKALYQNPDIIRKIIAETRTIAIVGLSTDTQKASYFTAAYLQYEGYKIIPVNPKASSILGETCYPNVQSIPGPVDCVDIFRPSSECPAIIEQAITIKAKSVWTQLRIVSLEAAAKAREAGLLAVMDKCLKMEHGRYGGGLHLAGMNTELISARKAPQGARAGRGSAR